MPPQETNADVLYDTAKSLLGTHLTLDPRVSPELGCAEAISAILEHLGIAGVPKQGFAGTYDLYNWLKSNTRFQKVTNFEAGAIIISPTGLSATGSPHGHVGICGKPELGSGIMSNDSQSGLFLELWSFPTWQQYYQNTLKFPVYFFRYI